jgi:hypothetical protein
MNNLLTFSQRAFAAFAALAMTVTMVTSYYTVPTVQVASGMLA